jgi:hypothetical protein
MDSKLSTTKFTAYINKDDPTRYIKNIATNPDDIRIPTLELYSKSITGNMVVYWYSPVRHIVGNSYTCNVITEAFIKPHTDTIKIELGEGSKYCVVGDRVLLCPGEFKFLPNGVATYQSMSVEDFTLIIQDKNSYLPDLSYKWSPEDPDGILSYLVDFHTRRVQRGYYSPEHSLAYQVFKEDGEIFKTEGKSYYESLTDNSELDQTVLPFYEYPNPVNLKLYCDTCFDQTKGKLASPLLLSIVQTKEYKRKVYVDTRLIDLNFVWTEKKRSEKDKIPNESCYSLSPNDAVYLQYATHSPGTLVAVYGHIRGNIIEIS